MVLVKDVADTWPSGFSVAIESSGVILWASKERMAITALVALFFSAS